MIAIIILHYGRIEDTEECLKSLSLDLRGRVPVVVVVNDVEVGAVARSCQVYPNAHVVFTGGNLGFAAGNNIGIRHALELGADHVVLLNNDTVVEPGFLEPLRAVFADYPDAGMATGPILYAAPPNAIWSAGGSLGGWTALTHHALLGQPRSMLFREVRETGFVNGCFVMVSRRCIERIGLMDERYFLYYEDTDWCVRARRAGFKVYFAPGPAVLHKVSAGTAGMRPLLRYYCDRNSFFYARRNMPWYAVPVYGTVFALRVLYRLMVAARSRDREAWRFAVHTLRDVIVGRQGPYGSQ